MQPAGQNEFNNQPVIVTNRLLLLQRWTCDEEGRAETLDLWPQATITVHGPDLHIDAFRRGELDETAKLKGTCMHNRLKQWLCTAWVF